MSRLKGKGRRKDRDSGRFSGSRTKSDFPTAPEVCGAPYRYDEKEWPSLSGGCKDAQVSGGGKKGPSASGKGGAWGADADPSWRRRDDDVVVDSGAGATDV